MKKGIKATNILWDVDEPEDLEGLPAEIVIPDDIDPEDDDAISDYLSDQTGFCHKGFDIEEIDIEEPDSKPIVKRCPYCGGTDFWVSVQVTQNWEVDGTGEARFVPDSDTAARRPNDDDLWRCKACGYTSSGRKFNVTEAQEGISADRPGNPGYVHPAVKDLRASLTEDSLLEELDLCVRAFVSLKRAGKQTIKDVISMSADELIKIRSMSQETVADVVNKLAEAGFKLKER